MHAWRIKDAIYIYIFLIMLTCKCDGSKDLMKKYHGNEQLVNGIVESKDMVMGFFILCTDFERGGERERERHYFLIKVQCGNNLIETISTAAAGTGEAI